MQEASWNMERQKEQDRLVSQHLQTITDLEKKIREYEINTSNPLDNAPIIVKSKEEEHVKKISELTHELVREQTYTGTLHAEIATLKSRLRDALDRADKAEMAPKIMMDPTMDVEMSPLHMKRRKRLGNTKTLSWKRPLPWARRGLLANDTFATIIESLDDAVLEAMGILRVNPLARIILLLYLGILHVWVLVLFLFHAHHSTAGSDGTHHGPHQLLRPSST
jgi:hypothetical protein